MTRTPLDAVRLPRREPPAGLGPFRVTRVTEIEPDLTRPETKLIAPGLPPAVTYPHTIPGAVSWTVDLPETYGAYVVTRGTDRTRVEWTLRRFIQDAQRALDALSRDDEYNLDRDRLEQLAEAEGDE